MPRAHGKAEFVRPIPLTGRRFGGRGCRRVLGGRSAEQKPFQSKTQMLTPEEFALRWNPGLENDDQTLEEVLRMLPGMSQTDVHFLVRFFENPSSRFALTGAVDLFNHDCIHIVLGRGLQIQDEAFVIGFTMGTSKGIGFWENIVFRMASRYFYPKEYRFNSDHMRVLDLATAFGMQCPVHKIYEVDFRTLLYEKISRIREMLGIEKEALHAVYAEERSLLPDTEVSDRLPVRAVSFPVPVALT